MRASLCLRWPDAATCELLGRCALADGAFAVSIAGKNNAEVVRKDEI
jgi:hypothetical protein